MSEQLNMIAVQQFYPCLLTATRAFLKGLLQDRGDVIENIRQYVIDSINERSFLTPY